MTFTIPTYMVTTYCISVMVTWLIMILFNSKYSTGTRIIVSVLCPVAYLIVTLYTVITTLFILLLSLYKYTVIMLGIKTVLEVIDSDKEDIDG